MDQPLNEPFIGPCTSHLTNHLMDHGLAISLPLITHQTVWPIHKLHGVKKPFYGPIERTINKPFNGPAIQ
jgi:hypothetical protein